MVAKSFTLFWLTAIFLGVAGIEALLPFSTVLLSYAATPTVEPRPCRSLPIVVEPQQTLPDPDWTIDGQVKQTWQQSDLSEPSLTEQWVTSVAFSPDGSTLASSSRYKDAASEQGQPTIIGVPTGTQGLSGRVEIWQNLNEAEWRKTVLYTSKREINAVAFNPTGTPLLAAAGNDKGFVGLWGQKQWNTPRAKPQDQANSQFEVNRIVFSPNGRLLASGGIKGRGGKGDAIQRWDIRQGKLTQLKNPMQAVVSRQQSQLLEDQEVYAIAFSPDSKILAAGGLSTLFERQGTVFKRFQSDSFLHLWEAQTGKYVCSVDNSESAAISAIAFSPDGTLLATGNTNGSIHLWSLATGELLTTLKHQSRVNVLSFSPSSQVLLSGSTDRTTALWKIPTGERIRSFDHPAEVTSVTFRPDGQAFAAGNRSNKIQFVFIAP